MPSIDELLEPLPIDGHVLYDWGGVYITAGARQVYNIAPGVLSPLETGRSEAFRRSVGKYAVPLSHVVVVSPEEFWQSGGLVIDSSNGLDVVGDACLGTVETGRMAIILAGDHGATEEHDSSPVNRFANIASNVIGDMVMRHKISDSDRQFANTNTALLTSGAVITSIGIAQAGANLNTVGTVASAAVVAATIGLQHWCTRSYFYSAVARQSRLSNEAMALALQVRQDVEIALTGGRRG